MKKSGKSILYLLLVILIIVVIILIGIIINLLNKNKIESNEKIAKEQLEETTTDNAYITLEAHNSELNDIQKELNNMQNITGQATVTADKILKDYTAYKNGQLITGTMANNGAVTKTLNAGGSYTIPAGYHNGRGKVTANSLASQTSATAIASDIVSGKTAWVNGSKVTGTLVNLNNIQYLVVGSGSVSPTVYSSSTPSSTLTCNISDKLQEYGVDMSAISLEDLILKVKTIGTHNCYVTSNKTVTINPKISSFNNTTGEVTISDWHKKVGDDSYGRADRLYVGAYDILLPYVI